MRQLTTEMVIEAIVESALLDHKDNLRTKLYELCRLAREEQRIEFRASHLASRHLRYCNDATRTRS